jgi:hypothetical protein
VCVCFFNYYFGWVYVHISVCAYFHICYKFTYIQEGRRFCLRFLSSWATVGRELSKMEKTREL